MKKVSTWYSVALAIFNVALALGIWAVNAAWTETYRTLGVKLPHLTEFALRFYWWPYLFVGIAILLVLASVSSRWPSSLFYHFLIIVLVFECLILFIGQLAFAIALIDWGSMPRGGY